jgi:hypothetical protein
MKGCWEILYSQNAISLPARNGVSFFLTLSNKNWKGRVMNNPAFDALLFVFS